MKRIILKTTTLALMFLAGLFISLAYNWHNIDDKSTHIEESKGNYMPYYEAKQKANNFDSDKKYFYKYYIKNSYKKSSFPFITTIKDTIDKEIWYTTSRN